MATSFDKRIVRYEEIHSIKEEQWDQFCSLIPSINGSNILDIGAGYGSCTREVVKRNLDVSFKITLSENSEVQLARAKSELPKLIEGSKSKVDFVYDDITSSNFENNSFDIVMCKMVIHEINPKKQLSAFKEIYRILKPNGFVVYWDLFLNDITKPIFSKVILEKDRLCGFKTLVKNRNFLKSQTTFNYFAEAGFKNLTKKFDIMSPVISSNRLKDEFKGDEKLLEKWHSYIRNLANHSDPFLLFNLSYIDNGKCLTFTPQKVIIKACKIE
jgi:ubiquinone/menaquinone biosynthesis C-methylase UbiE